MSAWCGKEIWDPPYGIDMEAAVRLLRAYLDFVHGIDRGLPARGHFTAYLEALRAATDRSRIAFGSDFFHPTWKRTLQYIINFGADPQPLAPVEVMSGFIHSKTEGPVNSFYRGPGLERESDEWALRYWSRSEVVDNLRAGIARADFSWSQACKGRPSQSIRIAALALQAVRAGDASPASGRFPGWLNIKERPRKATRDAAAAVAEQLRTEAPAPFYIPIEIFQQPSANKVALVAQYLEAQGLRPAQIDNVLRLGDLPRRRDRPVSRLLFDWRRRHPAQFGRQPSRYELPEPPSHLVHKRYLRV